MERPDRGRVYVKGLVRIVVLGRLAYVWKMNTLGVIGLLARGQRIGDRRADRRGPARTSASGESDV